MDDNAATQATVTNSQERVGCDPFGRSEREVWERLQRRHRPCMPSGHHCLGRPQLGHVCGQMQFCLAGWSWPASTKPRHSAPLLFLNTLGQVLRAIELPFIVGGDFNLAGEVLEESGWLHAIRARIAAPRLDGQRQGHRFLRGFGLDAPLCLPVAADQSSTVIRTHRQVVLTLEGLKRRRLVQRLYRPARLVRCLRSCIEIFCKTPKGWDTDVGNYKPHTSEKFSANKNSNQK